METPRKPMAFSTQQVNDAVLSDTDIVRVVYVARQLGNHAKHWRDENIKTGLEAFGGKLPHEKKRETHPLTGKIRISEVTEMDKFVSKQLVHFLQDLTPGIPVVSEEEPLPADKGDTYWVIDPIDGTSNFVNPAKKNYAVLVGLVQDGQPVFGATYYPEFDMLTYTRDGKVFQEQGGETTELKIDKPFNRLNAKGHTQRLEITSHTAKAIDKLQDQRANQSFVESLKNRNIMTSQLVGGFGDKQRKIAVDFVDFPDEQVVLNGTAHLGSFNNGAYEWDYAARHAIVRAAGGEFIDKETGKPQTYGNSDHCFMKPVWYGHPDTLNELGLSKAAAGIGR